ncbi:MAG: glycosyltransferase family 4 protein [Chloroflexi bacterium]|nr:glycosyltransferase family 4 protein [Chloroflexota bacterium]
MRVVMVSKALVVGQYQTKAEEIAKHPDIELVVVVPPAWRDERGILPLERVHTRGYDLSVAPIRFNGQFHLHYYPTLPTLLEQIKPDLVHIDEEPYNLATFFALRAAQRVRAKSLFFTWQNLARRYPPPFAWMEAYVLRHSDYALAGNAESVDVLRAKGYHGKASVIPQFGVDQTSFSPRPTTQRPNDATTQLFRIGYVGRFVAEKGVALLLRAVAPLSGEWELRLLGSGPEQARLETLARELGIASRVVFESWVASTEMPERLRALDALVLPSITRPNWKEQFGRVLIEAMACAVPVIGSTCGEIPHLIGDAGLIFPEGDAPTLTAHLAALRDDPTRRAELGARGRARVLAQYTQTRIAAETSRVYRALFESRVDRTDN